MSDEGPHTGGFNLRRGFIWNEDFAIRAKELYFQGRLLFDIAKNLGFYHTYFYNRNSGAKHIREIRAGITQKDYEAMCRYKLLNSKKYDKLQSFNSPEERILENKSQCFCKRMREWERWHKKSC